MVFGEVRFANQGVGCSMGFDVVRGQKMLVGGEYYRVNCPFCAMRKMHDLRQRLWIHHRWGIGPPDNPDGTPTRDDFRWAAHCFNGECLKQSPERRDQLISMVYAEPNHGRRRRDNPVYQGVQYNTKPGNVSDPGRCIRIDQLHPTHDAVRYLVDRGFDPTHLAVNYGVKYCEDCQGENWQATGRIIFPVMMDGAQATWQGRYVGNIDWKAHGIPKYYTCKHTHKGMCLFNFDKAKPYRFVFVVEGPTDAIAIGDNAVAIMGKSLSDPQFQMLAKFWDVIVLCIDGEAYDESEEMYYRLAALKPVVRVQLPDKADPASMIYEDADYFYQLVDGACRSAGYDLLSL